MKRNLLLFLPISIPLCLIMAFNKVEMKQIIELDGAWRLKNGNEEQVLLFAGGYFTHTVYNKAGKQFIQARGGVYTMNKDKLTISYEFDTKDKEQVGRSVSYTLGLQNNQLTTNINQNQEIWNRIDEGRTGLAGLWKITARQQEGKMVPIHQAGTRKTVKILTSSRFQWAAIDPGTKQFMGTGGGTYTFSNGKYTENIEFFSRDSSRVGSALSFDGKVENGDWHHRGASSKGYPIYEVWSRSK